MMPLLRSCFDTSMSSMTIYRHLFNDFFCLNKDIHQYNTRSSSNVHEFQARTNHQKHIQRSFNMELLGKISIKEIKTFDLFRKKI